MNNVLKDVVQYLNELEIHDVNTPVKLRPILKTIDASNARSYIHSFIIHICDSIHKKSNIYSELICRKFMKEEGDFYQSLVHDEKVNYPDLLSNTKKKFHNFLEKIISKDSLEIEQTSLSNYQKSEISYRTIANKRPKQEDRCFGVLDLINYATDHVCQNTNKCLFNSPDPTNKFESVQLIGVFDGHNGPEAAEHCHRLAPYLMSQFLQYSICHNEGRYNFIDAIGETFYSLNFKLNGCRNRYRWKAGTTSTMCLVTKDSIFSGWLGDSLAWLIFKDKNSQVPLTNLIHRPSEGSEIVDVQNRGGFVTKTGNKYDRVNSVLAVTRALGDDRKIPGVSALPSVSKYDLTDQELCIVLASDGLWDATDCDGSRVGDLCRFYLLNEDESLRDPHMVCQALVDMAMKGGASDNVTVSLLKFNGDKDASIVSSSSPNSNAYTCDQQLAHVQKIHSVFGPRNRRMSAFAEEMVCLRHLPPRLINYVETHFSTNSRMMNALLTLSDDSSSSSSSSPIYSYPHCYCGCPSTTTSLIPPHNYSIIDNCQSQYSSGTPFFEPFISSKVGDKDGYRTKADRNGKIHKQHMVRCCRRSRSVLPNVRVRFSSPVRLVIAK